MTKTTEPDVPAIEVSGVTVRYGEVTALEDTNLRVEPGRVCGLIGMNGAGKSTLFKTIMGLVAPEHGAVRVSGLTSQQARQAGLVSYVPQNEDIDWNFPASVRDVVMMGRYGHQGSARRARAIDHKIVDEALARVQLTDLANRQIGRLSGGQRKRAFVARGIAQEATILLLDEPFAGVDKRTEYAMTELIRELAAEDRTVLVSTHDLHTLPALADEAALMRRTVLMHSTPREVLLPDNLMRAYGVDVLMREEGDDDADH